MEFETVERQGHVYVVKNGVESVEFTQRAPDGCWGVMIPREEFIVHSCANALALIAAGMDTWYTVPEAAVRLVELGEVDKLPHVKTMCYWARAGRFPGAFKTQLAPGQGGSWRIPGAALPGFRKGG